MLVTTDFLYFSHGKFTIQLTTFGMLGRPANDDVNDLSSEQL